MANANMIKFYRGLLANLPATGESGAMYITTDEGAIYYGTGSGMKRLGDYIMVDAVANLPTDGASATSLYYCVAENILCRYDSTKAKWVQINKQPDIETLKTQLGLSDLAYLSEVSEDNLNSALKEKVNAAAEGNHSHSNKALLDTYTQTEADLADAVSKKHSHTFVESELNKIADGDVAKWHNKVDKESGKSLVADTEITKLAGVSEGANKVENVGGGKIKIDGQEVTVYAHPDKHAIADVDGLETALAGKSDDGHKHVKADITDFAHNHEISEVNGLGDALAGKQDVIAENTYDTYGAAAQALADAKTYVNEEDIFEIDMLTVNAHGGVAAGTDLNGLTTHEILKKILYPYVEPTLGNATASPNGGTYEKGVTKTITSISISVTKKSEAITSVALYNGSTLIEEKTGDAVKNGGTITFSNVNVEVPTNGNQLTVKVTDAANKTYEKKTSSMSFVYPYYIGTCAAGTAIDETLVESLTKKIEGKGNKSNSFTVSDGHMVFAYPKAHGVLKSILDPNNFETIGNYTRSEVSVTGLDGTAQAYYVYVSGATTVSGFTVNFKY